MNCPIVRCVAVVLFFAAGVQAADIRGVWAGQQQGRGGAMEDVAFQFKLDGQSLTGKVFGDEFDIPIGEAVLSGNQIRFAVMTTNYYSGSKVKFIYTGVIRGAEMELVRERVQTAEDKAANRPIARQKIMLKRLN